MTILYKIYFRITLTILFGLFIFDGVHSQHIGVKLPSKTQIDVFYYEIVDFNGDVVLRLEDNVIPFFTSYLNKSFQLEGHPFSPDVIVYLNEKGENIGNH